MNKIKNRCRSLDRNKLAPAIGLRDKNDVVSDWRGTSYANVNANVIMFITMYMLHINC